MHIHFDDNDWQSAIARYRASVALPQDVRAASLEQTRQRFNGDQSDGKEAVQFEPSEGGLSFRELVAQDQTASKLYEKHCAPITDDEASGDITTLRDAILAKKWTVRQVTEAFLAKAALAQQALGCYTEVFFDRARQRADELDAQLAANEHASLGRLFGVPISIKAHLGYKDSGSDRGFLFDVLDVESAERLIAEEESKNRVSPSTIALLRKQGPHIQTANGHMVNMLLAEGAVILAKTTMPQSIMHLDTNSNLYGQTLNPVNLHLSPGGSSGGEAASVASGATLGGLGTDIGGSVRQPASAVGLYGLRPTTGRLTMAGTRSTMLGNEGILGTAGPFARSMRDLALLTSILVKQASEIDPYLSPPLPWRDIQKPTARIRLGVLLDDGYVQPITPIRRALHQVVQKLQAHGQQVELCMIDPKDLGKRGWDLARQLYFMDNGQLISSLARMTGEPLVKLTEYILTTPDVHDHSGADAWLLQYTRETFKREFWQTVFAQNKLDVLLCATSATVAPRPQQIHYWGYTSLFNLTDLPGVSFPIQGITADAKKDQDFEQTDEGALKKPLSEMDEQVKREYEDHRSVFDRAPVGLQLIGPRWHEEELLGSLEILLDLINN